MRTAIAVSGGSSRAILAAAAAATCTCYVLLLGSVQFVTAQENDGSGATNTIIDYSACDESVPNYPYDCFETRAPVGTVPTKNLGHCHGSCRSAEEDCKPGFTCSDDEQLLRQYGCGGTPELGASYCLDPAMELNDLGFLTFQQFMMLEKADAEAGAEANDEVVVDEQQQEESTSNNDAVADDLLVPEMPALEFVGSQGPFELCQGDCDDDSDCVGDLVCYQRDGTKNDVPGCSGDEAEDDVDYCIDLGAEEDVVDIAEDEPTGPTATTTTTTTTSSRPGSTSTCIPQYGCLEYVADGKTDDSGFSHCQGNCFAGNDCSDDLKCVTRAANGDNFESVLRKFGCAGDLQDGVSYCVDADKKLEGFDLILFREATTPGPTLAPTRAPATPMPSARPTDSPTEHPTTASEARLSKLARRWTDVVTDDAVNTLILKEVDLYPGAQKIMEVAIERDPFLFTAEPSAAPSVSPAPTFSPTVPNLYPVNMPPTNPSPDYFDYSVKGTDFDSGRGPNDWDSLPGGTETRQGRYWNEFDRYIKHDIVTNMCGSGSNRQSPIDVTKEAATYQCFEFHQIRHKGGDYGVTNPRVEKQILPSKLRLLYPRDGFPSGDVSYREQGAKQGDKEFGPSADMPKRWGYQIPVTHVDIKIPSEHYMDGKQYPMEYQINLIQNRLEKRRGAPIISVLFDLHFKDKDNNHIETLIEQFEKVSIKDMQECENSQRRKRKLDAEIFNLFASEEDKEKVNTLLDEPKEEETKFQSNLRAVRRQAQENKYREWDPFHESIVRSVWFYGYEGSLTEPPCSEFVEWRIILEPALISKRQLAKLKDLLFNHVDENCQRTSVHSKEHGVARPLQPYNGHSLYTCTCLDFMDDESKDAGLKKCRFRDRADYGFDEDVYDEDWYESTHEWESIEKYWAECEEKGIFSCTGDGTEPWWA